MKDPQHVGLQRSTFDLEFARFARWFNIARLLAVGLWWLFTLAGQSKSAFLQAQVPWTSALFAMTVIVTLAAAKPRGWRLSQYALAFLDTPFVFLVQWATLPFAQNPMSHVMFTLAAFLLIEMLAILTLNATVIGAVALVACGCQLFLMDQVALATTGRVIGILALMGMATTIGLTAIGLIRAMITRIADHEIRDALLRQELATARGIQQSMLPREMPHLDGLDVAAYFSPADAVGGDYYDFVSIAGNRVAVAIGDVAGHGLGAAMMMAMAKSSFHSEVTHDPDIARVMQRLNDTIYSMKSERRFMTFFYAVVDPGAARMAYANAGHCAPLRLSPAAPDVAPVITTGSYPLGVRSRSSYRLHEQELQPGDVLVLYSDGIIEARDTSGVPYGFERLEKSLHGLQGQSATAVRDAILSHWRTSGVQPDDDVTLVVLALNPSAAQT